MFRVYLEGTTFGEFKNLKYISNPHNDPVVEVDSFAEIFQEYKISDSPLMIYPGNDNDFKVDYTLCEVDKDCYEDCYSCPYR